VKFFCVRTNREREFRRACARYRNARVAALAHLTWVQPARGGNQVGTNRVLSLLFVSSRVTSRNRSKPAIPLGNCDYGLLDPPSTEPKVTGSNPVGRRRNDLQKQAFFFVQEAAQQGFVSEICLRRNGARRITPGTPPSGLATCATAARSDQELQLDGSGCVDGLRHAGWVGR
jgi:hypothetical protein